MKRNKIKRGQLYVLLFMIGLGALFMSAYYLYFSFGFWWMGIKNPFGFFSPRWILFFVPLVFFGNKKEFKKYVDHLLFQWERK